MAFVILGLLQLRPMSLYDLVKSFEAGVSLFYSASSGSIKRALDQLLADGLVEVAAMQAGGRARKTHEITAAGQRRFRAWMGEPLVGDAETAALSRLYFLGLIDAADRPAILSRIRDRISADLARLEALEAQVAAARAEVPDELREVARFQAETLGYGLASHRAGLEWFRALAERLERPETSPTGRRPETG